eukprot:7988093-Ditylum_brightwellii.AAC.1
MHVSWCLCNYISPWCRNKSYYRHTDRIRGVCISYDEQWFVEYKAELGPIPLKKDFALADHVNESIEMYLYDYRDQTLEESKEHVMKLLCTILFNLIAHSYAPKVFRLILEKMDDVSEVLAAGSGRYSSQDSI